MAQIGRKVPTLSQAMTQLAERPAMTLSDWAVLNDVTRNTAAKAIAAGEVEGAYRVGNQTRIACEPWRQRFGILKPAPENAREAA